MRGETIDLIRRDCDLCLFDILHNHTSGLRGETIDLIRRDCDHDGKAHRVNQRIREKPLT